MSVAAETQDDPELAAAVWDLEPIVGGEGAAGARRLIAEAQSRADAFATAYTDRVASMDSEELVTALAELSAIRDLMARADRYASLRTFSNSADAEGTSLQGASEAAAAEIAAKLLFFDLEWSGLEESRAERLLAGAGPRLDHATDHLRRLRARRAHQLTPAEERVLAETSVPRVAAWKRLFFENANALTVELDGETLPLTEADSRLRAPERTVRLAAMAAMDSGLQSGLPTRVTAFNQLLGEKAVDDRLRGFATWRSSRNLDNGLSDAAVDIQQAAVAARKDIPRRWSRLKARLLGLETLATCDLDAPLLSATAAVPYARARDVILAAWHDFSPQAEGLLEPFFSDGRIDAPIRANKRSGAFCDSVAPSQHPYILTNYGARSVEVSWLAHELGHGLHMELCRPMGKLGEPYSIPVIEMPSTFSENLVVDRQLADAGSDTERLELLLIRLDAAILNVFRASAYHQAETRMHALYREQGELSADQLSHAFSEATSQMFGDTLEIEPAFTKQWSLMPHLVSAPGYLYAYSFGMLLAWSAHARYRELGDAFVGDYLAMLAAGGSRTSAELMGMIGLDLEAPELWHTALHLIEVQLNEAERLA
ncbi:MAG TPA: M3 family metallopeptidase [Solirubrobacteraceae bacterium]|jgi:oligoendopeptidase F|nr:M3 family metallopeptidase [Solirubrobacteraceae bacterium]